MAKSYKMVDSDGVEICKVNKAEIQRFKRLGQAVLTADGRAYRFLEHNGKFHPSGTRISKGDSLRAACGLSQNYVSRHKGTVLKFKHIDPIDKPAFGLGALFFDDPYSGKGLLRIGYG